MLLRLSDLEGSPLSNDTGPSLQINLEEARSERLLHDRSPRRQRSLTPTAKKCSSVQLFTLAMHQGKCSYAPRPLTQVPCHAPRSDTMKEYASIKNIHAEMEEINHYLSIHRMYMIYNSFTVMRKSMQKRKLGKNQKSRKTLLTKL